ncbi:hypothetical protein Lal_00037334, partial [Lupinus albus]
IRDTAFTNILDIRGVELNNHLLTTIVERWRSETHTFHFHNGECTMTLEYVAYQLEILIDGKYQSWKSRLSERFSPERELSRLGEKWQFWAVDTVDDSSWISTIPSTKPQKHIKTSSSCFLMEHWSALEMKKQQWRLKEMKGDGALLWNNGAYAT